MKNVKCLVAFLIPALLIPWLASANLAGPYAAATNTPVLLHFDEAAGGSVTTNVGSLGGNFISVNFSSSTAPLPLVTTMLGNASFLTNSFPTPISFNNCQSNNANAILDGGVISGTLSTDRLSNYWLTITNIGSGQHALWACSSSAPSMTTLYNNWASSWFGPIAGLNADPDGDGLDNYAEFIAGRTRPTRNPVSRSAV
jgi:hypothetical protein